MAGAQGDPAAYPPRNVAGAMALTRREKIIDAILEQVGVPLNHEQAERLLDGLLADGWVVLRAESVRQAQERQRIAEALRSYADELRAGTDKWARDAYVENARLRDRLTFVYGVARARGATVEELAP